MIIERIRLFLDIPLHPSLLQPLPHNDHVQQFLNRGGSKELVQCIVDHVPLLDCPEVSYGVRYYESRNQALYAWLQASHYYPSTLHVSRIPSPPQIL